MKKTDWPADVRAMHDKFGHTEAFAKISEGGLRAFLQFRVEFLDEEHDEMFSALKEGDADKFVDALVDYCVVAIGTLDAFGVDAAEAWARVQAANMAKQAGSNPSRASDFGIDLVKPPGWVAPSHADNLGRLPLALRKEVGE